MQKNKMIEERTWEEFRQTGLLWFINTILHVFGWAIAVKIDNAGNFIGASPLRVKYRGFDAQYNDEGYVKIAKYLSENGVDLLEEIREGDMLDIIQYTKPIRSEPDIPEHC